LRRWKTTKEKRHVPDHILRPDYAENGIPKSELLVAKSSVIPVYNEEEIQGI